MIVHSSIPFKIISIYPSIEHEGKIAVLIAYEDGRQEVKYLESL
jgi:hypothetical protein